jgi:mono/diheme cytochrome c family protein
MSRWPLALVLAAILAGAAEPALSAGFGLGAPVYEQHCASCHGGDGKPLLPGSPDFTRGESLLKSDRELMDAIRFGVGSMPGFDQLIDREGLLNVVTFIRTLRR